MINIFRSATKITPSIKISFFHNPKLATSGNLLGKLQRFSELPATTKLAGVAGVAGGNKKFLVDVEDSKLPSYSQYLEIYDFLSMHPENALSFEKAFPMMFDSKSHTLCKRTATSFNKRKIVLGDLEMFNAEEYEIIERAFYNQDNASFNAPLVVDWENSLIATDDKGLDRIMANYLSCGTQDTQKAGGYHIYKSNKDLIKQDPVHPHVAEFADLF